MKNNSYYKVTQLDTDLWAFEDVKSSEDSISYLLCGKNKALVFDTGLGLSPVLPLIKEITELPLIACLSHWHFDHSGGAHEFDEVIGWHSQQMKNTSENGVSLDVIKANVSTTFWKSIGRGNYQTKGFPLQMISQEQTLDLGGFELKVLHTPGHTSDSICLYEGQKKWLFAGDSAYPGPIYLHFADSDTNTYQDSLTKLAKLDVESIFPGHNSLKTSKDLLVELDKMLTNPSYKSQLFPELSIRKS